MSLIYDTTSYDPEDQYGLRYYACNYERDAYTVNRKLWTVPSAYMFAIQHVLHSIYQPLLYVSSWEFICCQSPQHLKGMVFGLLFATIGLNMSVGSVIVYGFSQHWASGFLSCHSSFYFLNLCLGVLVLSAYVCVARKYKYRKRDDICNYYQFAEEYYSKIPD